MNLVELLDYTVFRIGAYEVSSAILLLALFSLLGVLLVRRIVVARLLPKLLKNQDVSKSALSRLKRSLDFTLFLLLLIALWYSSGIDFNFKTLGFEDILSAAAEGEEEASGQSYISLTVRTLLLSFFTWQLAQFILRLFDTVAFERYLVSEGRDLVRRPVPEKQKEEDQQRARRSFRSFIKTLAILLIITILDVDFKLLAFSVNDNNFTIRVSNIISAILIVLLARLIIWLTVRLFLSRVYNSQKVDPGSQFAINQLFQYVVYFIALLLVLNVIGANPTVLAGSAAALLLGVGLGLQQTFNDFFSGILLLFERSVEVGDVVEVGGLVGTVRRIGLRTSQVQTLDNLTVIVPNSKLVTNSVTNWSHTDYLARFSVSVGVAYGSDTRRVEQLLLQVAKEHDKIMNFPTPFIRFKNFGNSSLDFELFFWSSELIPIENIMSDLRFAIDKIFRENGVEIPFPQRDLWIKNPRDLK
ncbi:MAG TPA: mechanosensitive ion channel domain-containing protein [Saprospiraceae bacterium]|nr:mechanosensitive ion channel domain-containing protein [Saprospiraceae bacterium]